MPGFDIEKMKTVKKIEEDRIEPHRCNGKLNPEAENQVSELMKMHDVDFATFLDDYMKAVGAGAKKNWSKKAITKVCIYWECKGLTGYESDVGTRTRYAIERFLYNEMDLPMSKRVF